MTVPDFPPSRHDRALYNLAKRCEDATTMGMFRIGDSKFLLAYSGASLALALSLHEGELMRKGPSRVCDPRRATR